MAQTLLDSTQKVLTSLECIRLPLSRSFCSLLRYLHPQCAVSHEGIIGIHTKVDHTARLACGNSENVIQMLQSRPGASAQRACYDKQNLTAA